MKRPFLLLIASAVLLQAVTGSAEKTLEWENISKLAVEMRVKMKPEAKEFSVPQEVFIGWWGSSIMFTFNPADRLNLIISGCMSLSKVVPASQIKESPVTLTNTKPIPADWWKDNKWHQVGFTWDTEAGTVRLFFDGEVVGERKAEPFEIINVPAGYVFGSIGGCIPCLVVEKRAIDFRLLDDTEIKKRFETGER